MCFLVIVLRVVAPRTCVGGQLRFGETCCCHLQRRRLQTFSRNAEVHLRAHRMYESGRPYLKEMDVIQW